MIRLTTESGAVYIVDQWKKQVRREGPHSPGINYDRAPDGDWKPYDNTNEFEVGGGAVFLLSDGTMRVSTAIVKVEEGI